MAATVVETRVEFHRKVLFLRDGSQRYKVLYGGRAGIKSWSIARALLLNGSERPLRILCARETMESISQSVHQLLRDQIEMMGLGDCYEVLKASIAGKPGTSAAGTLFTFAGLAHNVHNIKSLESYDILWVEEAQNVSKDSWETIIPTIRKPGSQIWVSFNPQLETDDTYRRFVLSPPPNSIVLKTSWRDNPWLSKESLEEIEYLRITDPDAYEHVYEGGTRSTVEGAIYKAEIARAEREGRFCSVPYDPRYPVDTFWDLGYADMVSVWFCQTAVFQHRFIDYLESNRQGLDWYINQVQSRGYTLGTFVLPWDGGAPQLGTGMSIRELLLKKGFKVRVIPQARIADGINAVRTIFHQFWFDGEKCADGIAGLRRYQWGPIPTNGVQKREPLHDAASHPADAMRTKAMSVNLVTALEETKPPARRFAGPQAYTPFG